MNRIGIMAALHDEIAALLEAMGPNAHVHRIGLRDYYVGQVGVRECVVVLARIGKVAAAATAVTLIREFQANALVFTGLAGAVADGPRVGDVVVANALLQHDMDASPLFPRHEIPLLGRSRFDTHAGLSALMAQCARDYLATDFLSDIDPDTSQTFSLGAPTVHTGLIVSGDRFINDAATVQALQSSLPDALCVEMEGAAVAQVCHEYGVPFGVLRTISDRADDTAGVDFSRFLGRVARHYSAGILKRVLEQTPTDL
ncbi:5'-methylthioadenosine/adenosylhomocysteine nucleosidase [Pusillimonas sp. MFBS29]|uniref:5'-methylthioadenosine/adenosylhomocysteine nucleosidase n=1 Tax=Pusillimonas sp. MFBS29 TaxID=2886690 RepID=UPI001D1008E1|nr:5'-methylthioadenosine/adenosylhomocysteine nucleosidase [Pusillimonas sp. MFBS29]MCC2596227.1 5'-methylthioadenosine/adenosylhomocysteine nucleosidase [Pusillimonas sp. MFBS29]